MSKIFKRDAFEVKALDDVSIDIASGEFLALDGTLRFRQNDPPEYDCAIDRPTSGELLVMSENVFRFNDAQSGAMAEPSRRIRLSRRSI